MKVTEFIACEDARAEVGNRVSLMGLYGDEVQLAQLPGNVPQLHVPIGFRIAVHVGLLLDPSDPLVDGLQVRFDFGQATVATASATLMIVDRARPVAATFPTLTLPLLGSGVLQIELIVTHRGEPLAEKTVKSLKILVGAAPA